MSELKEVKDLLVELMKDTYDAESQLVEALPKMVEAATNPGLKRAFKDHLSETKNHVARLEDAFEQMGIPAQRKKCKAMVGLVKEGDEACKEDGKPELVDAGIITAAQKVEHYEIAAYGTLRTYAGLLKQPKLAELFVATLAEEKASDVGLSEIAEGKLLSKLLTARK